MIGYIDGIDFINIEAMKYYSAPNNWTPEKRKDMVQSRIFSDEWIGSRKMDGFFERFVKDEDGNMFLCSRSKGVNGEYTNKIEWVPQLHPFFKALPKGTCLIGELFIPENEGSKNVTSILGCLKEKAILRQEKGDKLFYYPFDVLAYHNKNLMNRPIKERISYLDIITDYTNEYVRMPEYLKGRALWDLLQSILSEGGEGIVITNENSTYKPGKRSVKDTFKCKKELTDTIDCFILGANAPSREYTGKDPIDWKYWQDIKTGEKLEGLYYDSWYAGKGIEPITKNYFYGMAGSLKIGVMKDGQPYQIGNLSGLTDEVLINWKDYVGMVCEISGMEVFEDTKAVRHPRLIGWRQDKTKEECLWENI